MSDHLNSLFATYGSLREYWISTGKDGDLECDNDEFERFVAAEFALVSHPCVTAEEARVKSRMFADTPDLVDTIANDRTPDGKKYIAIFLRSLWPAEKPSMGENH